MGTLESYEVLELIGKGTFGKVSKIKRKEDGKVRLKLCEASELTLIDSCMEGIKLWSNGR